jgi:hypothetical protein
VLVEYHLAELVDDRRRARHVRAVSARFSKVVSPLL